MRNILLVFAFTLSCIRCKNLLFKDIILPSGAIAELYIEENQRTEDCVDDFIVTHSEEFEQYDRTGLYNHLLLQTCAN